MATWLFLAEVTNNMPSKHLNGASEKILEFTPSRTLENALLGSRANITFISNL